MAQVTSLLLRLSSVRQQIACLDWGGGNGLYCRLMRDQGYNFFNHDKYAEPFYCAGFTADRANTESYDVVTSFEVFEHLAEPRQELGAILALKPKLWIFSTQLYEKQERDWSYFGPSQGRHVFFYSERALHDFAAERGYTFVRGRHLHMFVDNAENPYLRSRHAARAVRNLLHGHRLPSLAAMVNFLLVQRHAYLRWQSDSELMKSSVRPDIALRGGP